MNVGLRELALIVIVVLFVFGPSKLPEVGQAIGRAVRAYRDAVDGLQRELEVEKGSQASAGNAG